MAIIGNFFDLSDLFDNGLGFVKSYFEESLKKGSEINNRINSLPIGSFEKVELEQDAFALEQVFYTKDRNLCFFESHLKYVDFQLILSGTEQMEYCHISKLDLLKNYNKKKDLIIYNNIKSSSKFVMSNNDIAVFYPNDGHLGLGKYKNPDLVYKTVVKVPIEFL